MKSFLENSFSWYFSFLQTGFRCIFYPAIANVCVARVNARYEMFQEVFKFVVCQNVAKLNFCPLSCIFFLLAWKQEFAWLVLAVLLRTCTSSWYATRNPFKYPNLCLLLWTMEFKSASSIPSGWVFILIFSIWLLWFYSVFAGSFASKSIFFFFV